jgi:hypothetical protein
MIIACGPASRGNGDDFGNGDGNGSCNQHMCSADLHDVVDCNGAVIQTCSGDLGCASGACVDPCQAAASETSSVGCDYYAVNPDSYITTNGSCYAAYIANTWTTPVSISVEFNGQQLDPSTFARIPVGAGSAITYQPLMGGMLMPNQVAILFLAYHQGLLTTACPSGITPAYTAGDAAVHGTTLGHAFHITTTAPVVAYDIFPYGGGTSAVTSATLLLPSSAWDTNYVAVDAYEQANVPDSNSSPPFIEIAAQQDATHVTVRPTVAIVGGTGVPAAAANSSAVYTLAKGQVVQFTQNAELNGSVISSDSPVGLWGGHTCMNVPNPVVACDAAHQQIPPVQAMGNRYAAVRYRNRWPGQEETPPWRLVGGVDGTVLTYKPAQPAGAPSTLSLGQTAMFNSAGQFTVESQDTDHPFYMAGYMTGCEMYNDGSDCRGDPEFVNVIPPDQFLKAYTFFTDPTYPETDLVLTRERDGGQFADVTIDCVGTVSGWQPIDAADQIEYTRVDLVTGNFQGVGNCNNGLHVASSSNKFGLVVWGWGSAATGVFSTQAVSYAYPAGASLKHINHVVIE